MRAPGVSTEKLQLWRGGTGHEVVARAWASRQSSTLTVSGHERTVAMPRTIPSSLRGRSKSAEPAPLMTTMTIGRLTMKERSMTIVMGHGRTCRRRGRWGSRS